MVRKDAWNDFDFFEYTKVRFMAQDVIYPGEGSASTWEKGSIQEEDITIINIYAPNIGAPQYVRQMLTSTKGEINSNTIIVGDFHTTLTPMDRPTKQKISKETQTLNDVIYQLNLIDNRCFISKQWISHFSKVHMEYSPG